METRLRTELHSDFGDEVVALQDSDAIDSLPGWDSAGLLNLFLAIEAEFGVQFDIEEMESLTDVASIRKRLDRV